MAKKTTPTNPPSIAGYSPKMDKAIKALSLAQTYAEDGAQFSAIQCAAEAIALLGQAKLLRDTYLAFK